MKVRIINHNCKSWHYNKIGEVFDVKKLIIVQNTLGGYSNVYFLKSKYNLDGYGISKENCVPLLKDRRRKLKRILHD